MKYIFGPVNSRRFGLSLGIDLSPDQKICNFDCLYCELEPAKPTDKILNPPNVDEIVKEVKEALKKYKDIDVITITSNGEPTLYKDLDKLVDELNKIKDNKKLLILSNGSLIYKKNIQKTLSKIDIVKLSLDCATKSCFKKLDRPLKSISIDLEKIINGMIEFRKIYKGTLIIEILVVKGINDKKEEFEKLNDVLQKIKPDRVDIGTIDRPPAYRVEPVSFEKLFELSNYLQNIPINIVSRKDSKNFEKELNEDEILNTLKHRPFTHDDIKTVFSKSSIKKFEKLLKEKKIGEKKISNVTFYYTIDK
ncbi:radical SAM protein [Nitrosophilus kaiyonis]|uniref:radical SAM protein n=1 Tax=Nitrosophilus kaiyonis TaxID=2930200 RepID=UPI00249256F6|nr:radical SAM protein [Nitrosophilus kaiyonis]